LGWLSFQPNGDISFGLCDRTYVSLKFEARIGVWSAYNRVRTRFEVVSDPSAADKVTNPHLTYHAPDYFHFKSRGQRVEEAPFWGIADVPITLQQQHELKWIRAVSAPLSTLRSAGLLRGRFDSQDLVISAPTESVSVRMSIDFIRPNVGQQFSHASLWYVTWKDVGVRLGMAFTFPQFATMAWAHYH
jgi:hypothetical protein